MKKKIISLIIMLCMLFAMGITSYAGYVEFNVTVERSGYVSEGKNTNSDPYSPRMAKEDGENRFYVTPTSFSSTGEIRGFSRTVNGAPVTYTSYPASMSSAALYQTVSNPYLSGPPAGTVCCLETIFGSSPITDQLTVHGRYTP